MKLIKKFKSNNKDKTNSNYKIFISHSSKDLYAVKPFTDFLMKIGVPEDSVICTSIKPFEAPFGNNIFEYLRQNLDEEDLIVIFMLSYNYYTSPVCLNEMGAAWIKQSQSYNFLLPGFKYEDIRGVIDKNASGLYLGNLEIGKFNDFKNVLTKCFNLNVSDTLWSESVNDFVNQVHLGETEINEFNMKNFDTYCIGSDYSDGCKIIDRETNEKELTFDVDFTKTYSDLCSVVLRVENNNWLYLYHINKSLYFEAYSNENENKVTIEIKGNNKEMKYGISIDKECKEYCIPFSLFSSFSSPWSHVREICFILSRRDIVNPDRIVIKNLKLK